MLDDGTDLADALAGDSGVDLVNGEQKTGAGGVQNIGQRSDLLAYPIGPLQTRGTPASSGPGQLVTIR